MNLEHPGKPEVLGEVVAEKVLESARVGIDEIDDIANEALHQLGQEDDRSEAQEKIKELRERFKESLGAYMRLIVLAGLAAVTPAHGARPAEDLGELREKAKIELQEIGITRDQRATYVPGVNDLVFRSVEPFKYDVKDKLKNLIPQIAQGRPEMWPEREDAWRLYLGLPQERQTFLVSEYVPNNFKEAYCYSIKGWFNNFMSVQNTFNKKSPAEVIKEVSETQASGKRKIRNDLFGGEKNNIMGRFTLGIGEDEKGSFLYYYDVWDLDVPLERDGGFLGKSFVIYDRLYFDKVTFEPIDHVSLKQLPPDVINIGVM